VEKTKYQSLVERLQQAQERVKEVEESREALRQMFYAIDFDMGITRKGKSHMLGVRTDAPTHANLILITFSLTSFY
jgi:hypothetical protein